MFGFEGGPSETVTVLLECIIEVEVMPYAIFHLLSGGGCAAQVAVIGGHCMVFPVEVEIRGAMPVVVGGILIIPLGAELVIPDGVCPTICPPVSNSHRSTGTSFI